MCYSWKLINRVLTLPELQKAADGQTIQSWRRYVWKHDQTHITVAISLASIIEQEYRFRRVLRNSLDVTDHPGWYEMTTGKCVCVFDMGVCS